MLDPVSRCPESLLTGLEGQGPCTLAFPGEITHHSQDWFQARDWWPGAVCAGDAAGQLCPRRRPAEGGRAAAVLGSVGPTTSSHWAPGGRAEAHAHPSHGSWKRCQFCLPFIVNLLFFFFFFFAASSLI